MTQTSDPARHLPMAPHSFQILLCLWDEARHGYSIIKEVEARSGGRTLLGTSTAYAAIKRMVKDELLEEAPAPADDASGGPRRRYYRITDFGRLVARAEGRRIAELNEMVTGSSLLRGALPSAAGEGIS